MSKDQRALKELIDTANATAAAQGNADDGEGEELDENQAASGDEGGKEEEGGEGEAGKAKPAAGAKGKDDDGDGGGEDPTAGMTPEQARDYWKRRADRHYAEWKKEKTKRQELQRGPLGSTLDQGRTAAPAEDKTKEIPKSLDDVENLGQFSQYILAEAKRQIKEDFTEEQLDGRVKATEASARKTHDGSDGFPEYDAVVDEYVVPLIKKNPNVFKLLRLMDDPGEAAYTLGMMIGFPDFREQIKGQGREDLTKKINDATKKAATVSGRSGGRQPSAKLKKEDFEAMSPEDFEAEIEKVKSGAAS